MYDRCLHETVFPVRRKRARLILLHKGRDKPVSSPSSYRPHCTLDTAGKLFKRILLQILNKHQETGALSTNQFGFRKGSSTEDAINRVLHLTKWANHGHSRKQELDVQNSVHRIATLCHTGTRPMHRVSIVVPSEEGQYRRS